MTVASLLIVGGLWTLTTAVAYAQTVDADIGAGSASLPTFDGANWSELKANRAQPTLGGLVVFYPNTSGAVYPLQNGPATAVDLWTGNEDVTDDAAGRACTFVASAAAVPTTADACFYKVFANRVEIYFNGNLIVGEEIRYTISDLLPRPGSSATINDFDSADTGVALIPVTTRDAARFVLVLDKSGSMAWSSKPSQPGCGVTTAPPPGCEPSRWELLNSAVNQLLALTKAYALPVPATGFAGDQFGAAFFNTTVSPRIPPAGFNTLDRATIDDFLTVQLPPIGPGGNTSIGAGAQAFESDFATNAGDFNGYMMIFSDGEQNTAPFLVYKGSPPTGVGINPTANDLSTFNELAPGINICPFVMRGDNPAAPEATTLMQNVADERCDGLTYNDVDISGEDLLVFFTQVMNDTLVGDKLETATIASGQLRGYDVAVHDFRTSSSDVAFTLLLRWDERQNGLRNLKLVNRDSGIVLTPERDRRIIPGVAVDQGDDYLAITYRQPFCNAAGECAPADSTWELTFAPYYEVGETFTYSLLTIVDNQFLTSTYDVAQAQPGVGEPLTVEIAVHDRSLTENLVGYDDDSYVLIRRPAGSLGNLLVEAGYSPEELQKILDELNRGDLVDTLSLAAALSKVLMREGVLQEVILPSKEIRIPRSEWTVDNTGHAQVTFEDTFVEGVYELEVYLNGASKGLGRGFTRTYRQTYYVPVIPAPEKVVQQIDDVSGSSCNFRYCFDVTILLVDSQGNYVGPGKQALLHVNQPEWGQVVRGPIIDHFDGTYTIPLGYRDVPYVNPTLNVLGVEVILPVFKDLPTPTPTPTVTPTPTPTITPTPTLTPTVTPTPTPPDGGSGQETWEYLLVEIVETEQGNAVYLNHQLSEMHGTTAAVFNALGQRGWDFVGMNGPVAVFRRPAP
jgi:hypothetical protein